MEYNTEKHQHRSIRLQGYDYSQAGIYFITICVKDKKCEFGTIKNKEMRLNDLGKIAIEYLNEIPKHFDHVSVGETMVMPNHIHLILLLNQRKRIDIAELNDMVARNDEGEGNNVGKRNIEEEQNNVVARKNVGTRNSVWTRHGVSIQSNDDISVGTFHGMSLQNDVPKRPKINKFGKPIAGSVSVIINQYKSSVKRWCNKNNHENFQWQSRFYDHIVRDLQSYQNISDYIIANPEKWKDDRFYKEILPG